ncbi:hypothetical protein [Anatilimnocola floriformis]|uniref:hypothetical protein n=1 Tax=Anatilimnocola floriformis TaxID=2948575 RepID=UPI0020C55BE9|nr:hypothetical protein [Anatilimnocola floriformis]
MATAIGWLRPQFSLRALLLLFLVVGVGLRIYRQPWQERERSGFSRASGYHGRTVSYRKDWQGKPVKHGVESWYNAQGLVIYEGDYVDDQYVGFRRYSDSGTLLESVSDLAAAAAQAQRQSYAGGGNVVIEWERVGDPLHDDRIFLEWQNRAGNYLQSLVIDREQSQVSRWNGRPALEEAERLLADLPPAARSAWLAKSSDWNPPPLELPPPKTTKERIVRQLLGLSLADGILEFHETTYVRDIGNGHSPLVLEMHDSEQMYCSYRTLIGRSSRLLQAGATTAEKNQPFLFVLLQRLAAEDYTLLARYGVLVVVPISKVQTPLDPSGVLAIQFPAGSAEERAWLEEIEPTIGDQMYQRTIPGLFQKTPVRINVSKVNPFHIGEADRDDLSLIIPSGLPRIRRSRRDLLGSMLWANHLRVEQREGELLVRY